MFAAPILNCYDARGGRNVGGGVGLKGRTTLLESFNLILTFPGFVALLMTTKHVLSQLCPVIFCPRPHSVNSFSFFPIHYFFLPLPLSLSLSFCLSHTHTHRTFYSPSFLVSKISYSPALNHVYTGAFFFFFALCLHRCLSEACKELQMKLIPF